MVSVFCDGSTIGANFFTPDLDRDRELYIVYLLGERVFSLDITVYFLIVSAICYYSSLKVILSEHFESSSNDCYTGVGPCIGTHLCTIFEMSLNV